MTSFPSPAKRLATVLLLFAGGACGVSTEQGKQMDERMRRIEVAESATAGQVDQQRTVIRERMSAVDEKLGEVQKKLDELNATAHRTGADVAAGQDRLAERVAKLQAQVDEGQRKQDELETALATVRSDLDAKPPTRKGTGTTRAKVVPDAGMMTAVTKAGGESPPVFAMAQEQERAGQKVVASELYAEFLRKWPGDPRAPDAWFRIGEIAYGEERYRDALTAYGRVAENFPGSQKAPDGLFRMAESMTALGMKDDAEPVYRAVGARYPKSAAAKKAAARIGELYPSRGR
jgi:tol-pal system protein YbgF